MPTRTAEAEWKGDLKKGKGHLKVESGAFESDYDAASRFESGDKTNPEELIGAAHAGCFSMALSNDLAQSGHEPESVKTTAEVVLEMQDEGPKVTTIRLKSNAHVPGIDEDEFMEIANGAKKNCPISKLLGAAAKIELDIELKN